MNNIIFTKAEKEIKKTIALSIVSALATIACLIFALSADKDDSKEIGFACCVIALIYMIVSITSISKQKKSIQELKNTVSQNNINMATQEMMDMTTLSLEKANLYLTRHYLINLMGKHAIIPYEDILWMYRYTYYENGRKKEDNIVVFTTLGEYYSIGSKKVLKDDNMVNTIFERCRQANPYIVFGFTDDNKRASKEMESKIKQIRNSGQDPRAVLRPANIEHTPLF